jgi:lactoylglutathione lyase
MIRIGTLFESHLVVSDLQRSMSFYGDVLGFELAHVSSERKVAFYWLGGHGASMLGLWEAGQAPMSMRLHVAFGVDLPELLEAPRRLRAIGVAPLDFWDHETDEPVVFAWMPAAALFFRDPDGHLLELLSMLPQPADAGAGVVRWSEWTRRSER